MSEMKYFDAITLRVLECAKREFGHYEDADSVKRSDELVAEGILDWGEWTKRKQLRLTPKGIKYYAEFHVALQRKHGHEWEIDDDGEIDNFAYSAGFCNGPVCKKCGKSFCKHCKNEFDIEECPKKMKVGE